MRRAAKVDAPHAAIANHLRRIGWSVSSTATVGGNFPDLVCARLGFTALVEVKSGSEDGAERKLTDGQREFRKAWQGCYIVAATPEQAERELSAALLGSRLGGLRVSQEGLEFEES